MLYEVEHLCLGYPSLPEVVKDASFSIAEGETVTILGPNGAGKSTLLNSLMGLSKPTLGSIRLDGQDMAKMDPKSIARQVAYVRQNQSPVFAYTVLDFVLMGRAPHMSVWAHPKEEDVALARDALDVMGIAHLADRPCTDISGGQRQSAAIARALVQEPRVILLDEPTAHLDFGNQIKVCELVAKLRNIGYAVIMTTHDPNQAIMLGGVVAVLDRSGHLVVGTSDEMLTEPALCELYNTELRLEFAQSVQRNAVLAVMPETCGDDRLSRPQAHRQRVEADGGKR